ncbi:NAD-P-binding protein [Flagelloscypha sp. PMI_526]|nr:NAD-P-binding protein [Flagelloscypha sp. PMI_526]
MDLVWECYDQTFPPASKFHPPRDVPDLTNKVVLVTGAISRAAVTNASPKELLVKNAKVYVAGRCLIKFQNFQTDIQCSNKPIFLALDLANLSTVKRAASHFYLTQLLLPALLAGCKARVVNTAAMSHYLSTLDFTSFKEGPTRLKLGSKRLGNILFSNELARRYGRHGIVSTAVNPGNHVASPVRFLLHEPQDGAITLLWAGTSPEATEFNGKYLIPWARIAEPSSESKNELVASKLWCWLEDQIALQTRDVQAKL